MLRQTISPMKAKKLLVKSLRDIRDNKNAFKFCELLTEAKKIVSSRVPLVKGRQSSNVTAPKLIHQLKKIIAKDQPRYVIPEKLMYVLHSFKHHSEKTKDLTQILVKINKLDSLDLRHKNSKEYLRKLIIATDYLISSYCKQSIFNKFFSRYPTDSVEALKRALFIWANYMTSSLLGEIFEIGRIHLDFTEEEQRQIGRLMIGAIEPIEWCIKISIWTEELHLSTLQKRSALQFLLDDYAEFPSKKGTLLKSFYKDKINKCVALLDDAITRKCEAMEYKFKQYQENQKSLRERFRVFPEDYNPYDEAAIKKYKSELPESHKWWAQYLQRYSLLRGNATFA